MDDTSCTYDKDCTLRTNSFTRTGYTFNDWNTKKNGSGTDYSNKETVTNLTSTDGGSVTLYAPRTVDLDHTPVSLFNSSTLPIPLAKLIGAVTEFSRSLLTTIR